MIYRTNGADVNAETRHDRLNFFRCIGANAIQKPIELISLDEKGLIRDVIVRSRFVYPENTGGVERETTLSLGPSSTFHEAVYRDKNPRRLVSASS